MNCWRCMMTLSFCPPVLRGVGDCHLPAVHLPVFEVVSQQSDRWEHFFFLWWAGGTNMCLLTGLQTRFGCGCRLRSPRISYAVKQILPNSGQVEETPDSMLFYTYLPNEPLSKDRVEAFSDGVYAIVATLLILDIWFVSLDSLACTHVWTDLHSHKTLSTGIYSFKKRVLKVLFMLFLSGHSRSARTTCPTRAPCRSSMAAAWSQPCRTTARSTSPTLVPSSPSACSGSFTTLSSSMSRRRRASWACWTPSRWPSSEVCPWPTSWRTSSRTTLATNWRPFRSAVWSFSLGVYFSSLFG